MPKPDPEQCLLLLERCEAGQGLKGYIISEAFIFFIEEASGILSLCGRTQIKRMLGFPEHSSGKKTQDMMDS